MRQNESECREESVVRTSHVFSVFSREFIESNERLSAHWDFSGDPCPVKEYMMTVQRMDGTVAVPAAKVPPGTQVE